MTTAKEEVLNRANLNYSNSPKRIRDIVSDGCWKGHRCFIVGGGESLKGFNFSSLDRELTIGINKSFIYYDSSLLFFSDSEFYRMVTQDPSLSDLWFRCKTPKTTVAPMEIGRTYQDSYVIRRSNELEVPYGLEDGINVWNNSGFGALVLAYLLGANPIYLLGFDMKCVQATHWHCGYKGQTVEGQNQRLHSFMMPFLFNAEEFKRRGTHIVNLNPDSALTCFHKTTVNKVL